MFIYYFGSLSTQHNWRHNRHHHGRRWWKCPPSTPHEVLRSAPTLWMDGRWSSELADVFFGGVEGVYGPQSASGDDALPQNWSVLRAMHTPTAPQIISACSGGYRPSIRRVGAEQKITCGALGGHFRRWWPWSAMVVMVVGGVRQINPL